MRACWWIVVGLAACSQVNGGDAGPGDAHGSDAAIDLDSLGTSDVGSVDSESRDGESGDGADTGNPADSGSAVDSGIPEGPTFSRVWREIIRPICTCHQTGSGAGGLVMRSQVVAYMNLVGKNTTSRGCVGNGNIRVIAGNAADSVIYRKTSAINLCGPRMPLGEAPLPQEKIDLIRDWIDAGALDN